MSFNKLSSDVTIMIFNQCENADPAILSSVCKQWHKITQKLFYNLSKNKCKTWGFESLREKYRSILPEHVNDKYHKEALVFRKIIWGQNLEFKWLFQYYINVMEMEYPKIPSIDQFLQIEEMITAMNDISFCRYSFQSLHNGKDFGYTHLLAAVLWTNTFSLKSHIQKPFEDVYKKLLEISKLDNEEIKKLNEFAGWQELNLDWKTHEELSHLFRMTRISDKIGIFQNMRSFTLCNNQIGFLPKEFKNLTKLATLHLETTEFNSISKDLEGMNNLREINIRIHPLIKKEREGYNEMWNKYKPAIIKVKKSFDYSLHYVRAFIVLFMLYKACTRVN